MPLEYDLMKDIRYQQGREEEREQSIKGYVCVFLMGRHT